MKNNGINKPKGSGGSKEAKKLQKISKVKCWELFDNINSGVAVYEAKDDGKDFVFVDFNRAAERFEKVKREDIVGKSVLEVFPGIKDFGLFEVFQRVWRTAKPEHHPVAQYKDDRIVGWRESYVYQLPSGEIVAVYDDLTEQKRSEHALKMSEQCFKAIADYTYYWEIWGGPSGRVLWTNPAVHRVTGYSVKELMAMVDYPMPLIYEADKGKVHRAFRSALRGTAGKALQFRLVRKDGRVIWVEMSWQPIYDEKGNSQGHRASIRDVTRRMCTQLQLQESENKYRTLLCNIPQNIFYKDLNSVYVLCNKSYANELGIEPDEIVGKDDYTFFSKDLAEKYRADDKMVMESGETEEFEEKHTVDGQGNIVHTVKAPVRDSNGNIVGLLGIFWDITERVLSEEKLQKSEEKYRLFFDSNPHSMWVYNIDTLDFLAVNDTAIKTYGYSRDEFLSMTIKDIRPPKEINALLKSVADIKPGVDFGGIWRHKKKDGTIFYVETTAHTLLFEGRQAEMVLSIDITDRIHAEQEIVKLAKFPDENPNPVFRISNDGTILYNNKAASALIDISKCLNTDIVQEHLRQHIPKVLKSSEPLRTEIECSNKVYSLTFAPVAGSGYVNVHGLDITSQKRTEEELQGIFNTTNYMICIADTDGYFRRVNDSFKQILGYSSEECLEKPFYDFIHPDDVESTRFAIREKVFRGIRVNRFEHRYRCKDGTYKWLSWTAEPAVKKGLMYAIAYDITDRKQVEQARQKLAKELEAKNKELESIIYVASHDLRSPLVNIQGFGNELLRHSGILHSALTENLGGKDKNQELAGFFDKEASQALEYILTSANKMDSVLNGLLRLSRLGTASLKITTLDMNALLADIADSIEYLISESKIQLQIDPLPRCLGDAAQINQVFSNLCDNAIKYLDNSRAGVIYISGKIEGSESIYCVADNGRGIAEQHQKKIFEIFHRLEPDIGNGEGLGLTIVRRILDKHNGRIWLESAVGKGAKFFVALPTC